MSFEEMNLGDLIAAAHDIREQKRALDKASKELGKEFDEMGIALVKKLDEQGVDKTTVNGIAISVSEQEMPQVSDWEALGEYIISKRFLHLLQRRVSATAFRELLQAGENVPGVDTWTKRGVNMRATH
ncbi:hypothetical protein DV711_06360 [Motiliproteus coralliicola]|uniref:Uncharacterized protein n=1 Tax=Motiliproteus coralliicola TaxID=2283196 RepID=A0A369WXB4_9GAMM|nr:hypothetical protein [Motiliproteus coralliicola]RDE25176.1 hypothetical protein DV711_06360 [Motiliproteus coralliicola]